MLETLPELESLTTIQLRELVVEALRYKTMSPDEMYNSQIYSLTSQLIDIYGSHVNVRLVVECVCIEIGKRVAEKQIQSVKK